MILTPWVGDNKPPLGTQAIPGHPLRPDYAWLFNEGSGDRVRDVVGGLTGTLTNMIPAEDWVVTERGIAVETAGVATNQNVAITPIASQFAGIVQYTALWIGVPGADKGDEDYIYGLRNAGADEYDTAGQYNGNWAMVHRRGKATNRSVSAVAVVAGEIASVVHVFDGSQSTDVTRVKLYLDGIQLSTTVAGSIATMTCAADGAAIGAQDGTGENEIHAQHILFALWLRALSAVEVTALYAQPYCWLGVPSLAYMEAATAVPAGMLGFQNSLTAGGTVDPAMMGGMRA